MGERAGRDGDMDTTACALWRANALGRCLRTALFQVNLYSIYVLNRSNMSLYTYPAGIVRWRLHEEKCDSCR